MGKVKDTNELREEIRLKFKENRGAHSSFCREKGITGTWFTWVLTGKYQSPSLLLDAAEWITSYLIKKRERQDSLNNQIAERLAAMQD